MSEQKTKYDMNRPEAKALMDEIVHGTFMKEGTMTAFPTCFPGASVPIPLDESRITALDITPKGIVYGGTSGRRAHLFVGMFHGVTGIVFDLKTVEDATECVAVACGQKRFAAFINGPRGGGILAALLQPLPFDLIQEWGFVRPAFDELGPLPGREPVVHAAAVPASDLIVGTTASRLFTVDLDRSRVEVVGEIPGADRMAVTPQGIVVGHDGPGHLWRFDPKTRNLERRAYALPPAADKVAVLAWSRGKPGAPLYAADGSGRLFAFDDRKGFSAVLGQAPLASPGALAVVPDGRLFGFCGPDLAKMFVYDPASRSVANLGVAVSVLERRRYGYVFGDAVTGRDGEVYFGENDNLGHLWIYFPKIRA